MSIIFDAIGTVFRFTFWTGVAVVVGGGTLAVMTKPPDATFNEVLKEKFKDKIGTPAENKDPVIGFVKNVVASAVPSFIDYKINDYVLVKIAVVKTGKKMVYVGTLNNWIPLGY